MRDIREQLKGYDQQFNPEKPEGRFQSRPGLDTLADGDYEMQIVSAETDVTAKQNIPVLRVLLRVLSGPSGPSVVGAVVEKTYILGDQQSVNILGTDLVTLGFDADQWRGERSFSEELMALLLANRLNGLAFKGHKKTNESKGKKYHNLYINTRISSAGRPMPIPVFQTPTEGGLTDDEAPF